MLKVSTCASEQKGLGCYASLWNSHILHEDHVLHRPSLYD